MGTRLPLIITNDCAEMNRKRKQYIYLCPCFIIAAVFYHSIIRNMSQCFNKKGINPDLTGSGDNKDAHGGNLEEEVPDENPLELWKAPTLLDIPFTWILNSKKICKSRPKDPKDLQVLPVLVHSARAHFDERSILRETLGSIRLYKKWLIRLIFLLGEEDPIPNSDSNEDVIYEYEDDLLMDEHREFKDLVVGSFVDSHRNLTYKHLMGYKWVLNFCEGASLVMKMDDDVFVNIMKWIDWRSDDLDKKMLHKDAVVPDLYCRLSIREEPIRNNDSKKYVSEDEWSELYYPDYCSGSAYALTVDEIKNIYSVSNERKFFWKDDVFVTGDLLRVASKKFNFKTEISNIAEREDILFEEDYRPLCDENGDVDYTKVLSGSVALVDRGDLYESDMLCLHNKTLYEHRIVTE